VSKQTISIELSEDGVEKALRELSQYKRNVLDKENLLRQKVAEFLASESQSGFNGAIVDDLTDRSGGARYGNVDVSIDNRGNVTVVVASGEDAVWIEFGAGVYHNGAAGSSPNPYGAELGFTIGGYGKGNGRKEKWGFYENGELKISRGTPALMPMAKAVTALCDEFPRIAKEVFG
jgi:hypothetical protein